MKESVQLPGLTKHYSTKPKVEPQGSPSIKLKKPNPTKKRLTVQEERAILNECLLDDNGGKLVEQYWNLVFHTIQRVFHLKRFSHTNEDIEDLRSETFVQLFKDDYRKLRQYKEKPGHSLAYWIILITNSTVLNHLRKKRPQCVPLLDNQLYAIPDKEFAKEDQEVIKKSIEKLPHRSRLILKMHYYHELPPQEIADNLQISVGALYTAKSRAVEKLKKIVEESL